MPPKRNSKPPRRWSFQDGNSAVSKPGKSSRGKGRRSAKVNKKTEHSRPAQRRVGSDLQEISDNQIQRSDNQNTVNQNFAATQAAAFLPRDDSGAGFEEASQRQNAVRQPGGENSGPSTSQNSGSGGHNGDGENGSFQMVAGNNAGIPAAMGGQNQMAPPPPAHGSQGNNAANQQGRFSHSQIFDTNNFDQINSLPSGSSCSFQISDVNQVHEIPDPTPGMHDPVSGHIPQKIKDKIWRGEYIHFGLLLKSAKELAVDPMLDGDLVLKGGTLTVINKKSDAIHNIHTWTTAFIIYMDILLERWPGKAREYLKYMHNIRLAATRNPQGWVAYDEQFRLKKVRFPSSSWGLIDQELWIVHVATHYSTTFPPSSNYTENRQSAVGQNSGNQSTFQNRGGGFQRFRQRCFRFNEDRCTFGKKCKFEHRCSKCGSGTHGAIRCRN